MKATHTQEQIAERAAFIWSTLTADEKFGCKFGLFPFQPMQASVKEGYDNTKLSVALMKLAGGK